MKLSEHSYKMIFKKHGDIFYFHLPEIGIIAYGNTPDQAYENLEKKKNEYFKELEEIGADKNLINIIDGNKKSNKTLNHKWVKQGLLIAVIVLFFLLGMTPLFVTKKIITSVDSLSNKIEKQIDRTFNPNADKKVKRIEKFKVLMKDASPYIKQIKKTWKNN